MLFIEDQTLIYSTVATLVACCIYFFRGFFKNPLDISENQDHVVELIDYIKNTVFYFVKRQAVVIGVLFTCMFIPSLFASILFKSPRAFIFVMILIGIFSSGILGFIATRSNILSIFKFNNIVESDFKSQFQVITKAGIKTTLRLLGYLFLDLVTWFFVLFILLKSNIGSISTFIFSSQLNLIWNPDILTDPLLLNKYYLVIWQFFVGYLMGFFIQTFLSCLRSGLFATSADITADFIGQTEFDLPEDDLRNPVSIADQAGDQLKNSFSSSLILLSTALFALFSTSFIGVLNGIKSNSNSFILGFSPFLLLVIVFVFLVINYFLNKSAPSNFSDVKAYESIRAVLSFICIAALSYLLVFAGIITTSIWIAFCLGLVISLSLIGILYLTNSNFVSLIKNLIQKTSLGSLNGIIYGFMTGFLGAFTILLVTVIGLNILSSFFSPSLTFLSKLYLIGIFNCGILSSAIYFYCSSINLAAIDNVNGCRAMMSTTQHDHVFLKHFEILSTTSTTIVNSLICMITLIASFKWIFFYCLNINSVITKLSFNTSNTIQDLGLLSLIKTITNIPNSIRFEQMLEILNIKILNPVFYMGIFTGIAFIILIVALLLCGLENCTSKAIEHIRNEFSTKQGIYKGEVLPNYEKTIVDLFKYSQFWMFLALVVFFVTPFATAIYFGVAGSLGMILGSFVTSSLFALIFFISGAYWKNTRKLIEINESDYIGSHHHVSSSLGDSIGDILKNMIAPMLIITTQLICLISLFIIFIALKNTYFIF